VHRLGINVTKIKRNSQLAKQWNEQECPACEGCGLFRDVFVTRVCRACGGHGVVLVDEKGAPHVYESTLEQKKAKIFLEDNEHESFSFSKDAGKR
jgi:DnaJ-class molecular chaperone